MFNQVNPYGNYSAPYYVQRNYNQPQSIPQPQPQMTPQMQMPMAQQMAPVEMPIQDIKYVNKAQAEAYIVYPNTKVMLIDKESGIVYIKTADGMGQSKTDYFKFEPINSDGSPIKEQDSTKQVDFEQFVKKDDIKNLGFVTIAQYNELVQKLDSIQKQFVGGRQNGGQPKQSAQ